MRGKGITQKNANPAKRITPAYAGKSYRRISAYPIHQDHPRLCGEKFEFYVDFVHDKGSPPPMRGKEVTHQAPLLPNRITPAYAGKSLQNIPCTFGFRDHPRLCGEKPALEFCILRPSGSPPPMRGKGHSPSRRMSKDGITPAYAGKSKMQLLQNV